MLNFKKYALLITFATLIVGISTVDMVKADKSFSELENRVLSKKPTLTSKNFLAGEYSGKYEKYINDQFLFRNSWIDLKSRAEYALGKIENNGIIYGKDSYMFEKFDSLNEDTLTKNVDSIKVFMEKYNLPTTFALIPNSYMILGNKLPKGSVLLNQFDYINTIYQFLDKSAIRSIDLSNILSEHKEDYIYYRTDHHWTTYGAYLGYTTFVQSLGLSPVNLETLNTTNVTDFYGTYFSKTKLFNALSDTITYYPMDVSITIDAQPYEGLYDMEKWELRDKYAGFLWGNNGVTVIKSTHNMNKQDGQTSRILVFKDSYANSFIPFLTYNFDEIHVIDLRSLPMKLSAYMSQYAFDEVLIMYNFKNFAEDTNITRIKH